MIIGPLCQSFVCLLPSTSTTSVFIPTVGDAMADIQAYPAPAQADPRLAHPGMPPDGQHRMPMHHYTQDDAAAVHQYQQQQQPVGELPAPRCASMCLNLPRCVTNA